MLRSRDKRSLEADVCVFFPSGLYLSYMRVGW